MLAREHIEFSVEDGLKANVAHLAGVDGYVLVLLLPLLLPELLSALGMALQLLL